MSVYVTQSHRHKVRQTISTPSPTCIDTALSAAPVERSALLASQGLECLWCCLFCGSDRYDTIANEVRDYFSKAHDSASH